MLGWSQLLKPRVILQNLSLLLLAQVLKASRIRLRIARVRWPVRIEIRPLSGFAARIWRAIPSDHAHRFGLPARRLPVRRHVVVRPIVTGSPVLHPTALLLRLPPLLPRRLPLLLFRLLLSLLLRRFVLVATLRGTRQCHRCDTCRREYPFSELESQFHFTLHLLVLLLSAVVYLHRLRQFRQQIKIRKHVVVLQHRNILRRNRNLR